MLDFSADPTDDNSKNVGYSLVGAYAIVYIGLSVNDNPHRMPDV